MRATMDLASEMGAGIKHEQEMRAARGKMLFAEYTKKLGKVQADAAPAATEDKDKEKPGRQKIAE